MTILILFTVFGLILLSELRSRAKKDPRLKKWATVAVLLFLAGEGALVYLTFIQPAQEKKALLKKGVTHPATVVDVRQTGNYRNRNPEVELVVEVRPKNRATYQARKRLIMNQVDIPQYTKGTEVEVVVDPADGKTFIVKGLETP